MSLITFITSLVLGVYVFSKNPGEKLNLLFLIIAIFATFVTLPDFLLKITTSAENALLYAKIYNVGWLFFVSSFFYFLLYFGEKKRIIKASITYVILFGIPLIITYFIMSTGQIVASVEHGAIGFQCIYGPWNWLDNLFLTIYPLTGLYFCAGVLWGQTRAYKKAQAKIMLIGTGAATSIGILFGVFLPAIGIIYFDPIVTGPTMLMILGSFTYAILRYRFLTITPETAAEGIINAMPDALFLISPETKILRVNKVTCELTGFGEKELLGRSLAEIFAEDELFTGPNLKIIIGVKHFKDYQVMMRTKKGDKIPLLLSGSVFNDEAGDLIGMIVVGQDIREISKLINDLASATTDLENRKNKLEATVKRLKDSRSAIFYMLKDIENTRKELAAASQAKSDFLANMSHELRTPLNSIIGFSDVLRDGNAGPLNEQQMEFMNDIYFSGKHLLSLINNILDLAKIESGKVELKPTEFNLKELLENSIVFIKEKAIKHNIRIALNIHDDVGIINADELRIKQVVYNLLANAVKFTPDGGQVGLEAIRTNEEIKVIVSDSGIGIVPEDLGKLFHEFVQIDSDRARKFAGTGLGLAISKNLIELHSGRIYAESEGRNKGSKFIFILPAPKIEKA